MAVHTRENEILCTQVGFEARYDEGLRYLDHCGKTLVAIQKEMPNWRVVSAAAGSARLVRTDNALTCKIDSKSLAVFVAREEVSVTDAQRSVECLAADAERLYDIVVNNLQVPNTTRIGVIFTFAFPADSVEEADKFVCRSISADWIDEIGSVTGAEVVDLDLRTTVLEDSGYKRHIRLFSAAKVEKSESPLLHGFPDDEKVDGMVMLEIDTFTRPDSGHFPVVERFVNDTYSKACAMCRPLVKWTSSKQKAKS